MYKFDHNLTAPATIKERIVWVIYLGLLFFLLYGASNQFAGLTSPHQSIVFDWEKNIPFVDIFIFPYMSSDIIFVIALLLPQSRFELRVLVSRITFLILVSVFIFVLFPLECTFIKPINLDYKWLFDILKADLSFNQMPSLHISLAIILFDSMRRNIKSIILKIMLFIWIILICASTLLVYQHHFIDIPTGAILALFTMYIFPYKKFMNITQRFSTPRSLKMGIFYLVFAIIFIFIAFYLTNIYSLLFIYLFISMIFVSLVYSFGIVEVMSKKRYYIFLLPYFIANYISWLYYKNKLPLYNQLDSNIYFGRMPSKIEYERLKGLGIDIFINLASDLKFINYYAANKTVDFLDMTIQNPIELNNLYQYVKKNKDKKVFVHCKFGLSRTIIFLLYYLYREKKLDVNMLFNHIKKIDSIYKLKEYMKVNILLLK